MRGRGVARRYRVHTGLSAIAAVLVAGVVVVGGNGGYQPDEVRLASGAAWLSSSRVGQVTLLDGSSAEVSAQVQVASAGNALEVAQQGSTAYAVDQTTGTVRRVDGATFDVSAPVAPIADATAGLTAIPGRNSLYMLDSRRGVLANADPNSLTNRGELMTLASQLTAGTATVDDSGTLWAIDNATGDLTRVAGANRTVRRGFAQPGKSILTMVNSRPVVVDPVGRKAITVDRDTGQADDSIDLDLRPDDTVAVSGSARSDRLYLVVGRGVLNVCDLSDGNCDRAIPLAAGGQFGAVVEAGARAFVPDYATGQVWIIELSQSRVVAKPTVLTPGPFQLLARDGVVFYNDTNTERAGVVRLNGTIVPVVKYDAADPDKGVIRSDTNPGDLPVGSDDPAEDPADPPVDPNDPRVDPNDPPLDPVDPNDPRTDPNDQPVGTDDPPPNRDDPPPDRTDPPPPPNPDTPAEPVLEIVTSKASPRVGDDVTLQVNNKTGDQPTAASWTFGDGGQGTGVTTSHRWTAARDSYLVTATATLSDGRRRTISVNVTVFDQPKVTLIVSVQGGGGTVSGDGVNCPPTCQVAFDPGTRVRLAANPDATHRLGRWSGGDCNNSTAPTCDVIMDPAKTSITIVYRFDAIPANVLTVSPPSGGSVLIRTGTGDVNCPSQCSREFAPGSAVTLFANPDGNHEFDRWNGACAGQLSTQCSVTMNGDRNVSVQFKLRPQRPVITSLTCRDSFRRYDCTVEQTGGTQFRWRVNGRDVAGGGSSHGGSCPNGNFADVEVIVSNDVGETRATERAICDPEPPQLPPGGG